MVCTDVHGFNLSLLNCQGWAPSLRNVISRNFTSQTVAAKQSRRRSHKAATVRFQCV
jgi:hypothetical protein